MFSFCVYFVAISCCLAFITFCRKYYLSHVIGKENVSLNNRLVVLLSLLLASLPLIVVGGFRNPNVGTDTISTYYQYYFIPYVVHNAPLQETEFGFTILVKLAKFIFGINYTGMLIVISTFTTTFSMLGVIRAPQKCQGLYVALLYLCFLYFDSFNVMRQMCSVSVIFASLHFLEEKKPFYFLLAVCFALMFHNSTVICLLILCFYIVSELTFVRRILPYVIVLAPIFLVTIFRILALIPFFSKYVQLYSDIHYDFSLTNFAPVIYNLPAYVVIFMNRKNLIKNSGLDRSFIYVLLMMVLTAFTCNLFKIGMVWLTRLAMYFSPAQYILLPLCERFYKQKRFYRFAIIAYCCCYFILFYFVLGNSEIYPYTFV